MDEKLIDIAKNFTKAYQDHYDADPAIREMMCNRELFPGVLLPLRETDFFAGRIGISCGEYLPVDFHTQSFAQIGYMMNPATFRDLQKQYPARSEEIEEMMAYWRKEATMSKILSEATGDMHDYLFSDGRTCYDSEQFMRTLAPGKVNGAGFISGSYDTRVAGIMPDFGKLMQWGLPGMREEIDKAEANNPACGEYYRACRMAVDLTVVCCEHYRQQALALAQTASSAEKRQHFAVCAEVLEVIKHRKPETLREGIQLMVIFLTLCRTRNHGRLDETFGDLLAHDLDTGLIDEEQAVQMTMALWDIMEENEDKHDTRIIIGGIGRRNPDNADRFAMVAMEATRRRHSVMPVLTFRWSKTLDPKLLEKALELIGEGCIYPTLYNDDVYIEGCQKIMHVPYEDACAYAPLGCGEMLLMGCSSGSPNSTMRFLKALEATLHNGHDGADGKPLGIPTGEVETFTAFEDLENALQRQIRAAMERDVKLHLWNRKIAARETAFVFAGLLMDDCLKNGKGLHAGGLRYFGANTEGFGVTNTANSLAAIKKYVYDEKKYTLRQIVTMLDADYVGYEQEQKDLLSAPKYGNNDPYVDDIKTRLEDFISHTADEIGRAAGLDWYTVANVNPGGITIGPSVAASADGRNCGKPMALGNSPMPGTDVSGLTSLFLSAAKTHPDNGGCVTNMNLSRETITADPEKFRQLVLTYFAKGGLELNINCFSRGDLEAALEHPENYGHIIVRVSGYSAKFINLDPITQKHIMNRTLY